MTRHVWIDLLVVTAAGLTFTAVALSHSHSTPESPPSEQAIQAMADELGVTADQLRHAAEVVPPPGPGMRPSAAEREHGALERGAAFSQFVGDAPGGASQNVPPHQPAVLELV